MPALEKRPVDIASPLRCKLGESPLWSPAEAALWWIDIDAKKLHRLDPSSGALRAFDTPKKPGCIGLHRDGGFVATLEDGFYRLAVDGDALTASRRAAVQHPRDDMRFNDGRVDRAGRFWASSMVSSTALGVAAGALYRFDAKGVSAPLVSGLVTGNGSGFSPDGGTMYLSDSHGSVRKIWRFELRDDGSLADRRVFVDMADYAPGRPDGAAVDADGCYWICATDAGAVLRFTPEGKLDRAIAVPTPKPTMPAFGGSDLKDLYVASLQPKDAVDGYDASLAGAVFVLRPGVQGLAEPAFNGDPTT